MLTGRKHRTPIERFLNLVTIAPGCWEWKGAKGGCGYGQFRVNGRKMAPYRFIWEHINGPMPRGLEPDHLCNNRNCCNPAHIEPVTHAENLRRAAERRRVEGRSINYPRKLRPSHCPHGHEYAGENSIVTSQNTVQCRACNRARCLAYQARKRTSNS